MPQSVEQTWPDPGGRSEVHTGELGFMPALREHGSCLACTRTYDRIAPLYDLLDAAYERAWKQRLRAELFEAAGGRILDVGVGTGCNIRHYPKDAQVIGIDSSPGMLARAERRAAALGRPLQLHEMNLLSLAFPDQHFDTVVATFVLLCLPEQLQLEALSELRRVCKPTGSILVLDYRLSERPPMRLLMRCLAPWLRWAFAGRYDARTEAYVEAAGLEVADRRFYMSGSVIMLILRAQAEPHPAC